MAPNKTETKTTPVRARVIRFFKMFLFLIVRIFLQRQLICKIIGYSLAELIDKNSGLAVCYGLTYRLKMAYFTCKNGVVIPFKMGAYPFPAECLPNLNGVPTHFQRSAYPFFKGLYPFFKDSLDFFSRVYRLFQKSPYPPFSNTVRTLFEYRSNVVQKKRCRAFAVVVLAQILR